MGKHAPKTASFCTLLALLASAAVTTARPLNSELVSDGSTGPDRSREPEFPFLRLPGEKEPPEGACEELYGFLPCSAGPWGNLFLIVVYEYLLYHGESYLASGGERIFKILGPGIFGTSAFQVLGALPESLILLASGLLNGKEKAQGYVETGVGLLAGSSIFYLTLLWGTCIIVGSKTASLPSSNENYRSAGTRYRKELMSMLIASGVSTDVETSYTARIMVLSVVPFVLVLVPNVVVKSSSAGFGIVILVALAFSAAFLLMYFLYQTFEPWIQKRRFEYLNHEHLVVSVLNRVQELTMARLLTEDGTPNTPAIRRLFREIDQDGKSYISYSELKQLLQEIKFKESPWDVEKVTEELMKQLDLDDDRKITMDEFVDRFKKWLDETKRSVGKTYHTRKSLKEIYRVLQPWIQKKEAEMMKHLISEIIKHVSFPLDSFYKEDGSPDVEAIKRLFEKIDTDGDNCVSKSELKELLADVNFGTVPWDVDQAATKIMEELDLSGDQLIDQDEFVLGFTKFLDTSSSRGPLSPQQQEEADKRTWEEMDLLMENSNKKKKKKNVGQEVWNWAKALGLAALGIVILGLLAEPLISSVERFSASAGVDSFFISFVLVPLATNTRGAISAVKAAGRKKQKSVSLALSEMYGVVFMNNVLGFSVLLVVIYFRGLLWAFSPEVFVVFLICSILGLTASFKSNFPIWTALTAFLLYPLSLLLVYLLETNFWLS